MPIEKGGAGPMALAADEPCCPPAEPTDARVTDADEELAALAKALGHPVRVRIIKLLTERTECVCGEICDELPLAQSTVSQHLKTLREAGLVRGEVDGPKRCYCVNRAALERFKSLAAAL